MKIGYWYGKVNTFKENEIPIDLDLFEATTS